MAINKDEISLDREALKAAAADYHAQGFNCAQSVICAMAPKLGLDDHTAFALAEGFERAMGGMTETCGAIAGGIMALGQVRSSGFDAPGSKGATYRMARAYCDAFRDKNGSTICRELKGVGTDTGALRSCARLHRRRHRPARRHPRGLKRHHRRMRNRMQSGPGPRHTPRSGPDSVAITHRGDSGA